MPKIEDNTAAIIRRLQQDGWVNVGGKKHDKFEHAQVAAPIIVPRHRTLSQGVARQIHKAAGWL